MWSRLASVLRKIEASSSLLGKLAPPFLCYKHIPSYNLFPKAYIMHNMYSTVKLVLMATCIKRPLCDVPKVSA